LFFTAFPIERVDVFSDENFSSRIGCSSTAFFRENVASFDDGWNIKIVHYSNIIFL